MRLARRTSATLIVAAFVPLLLLGFLQLGVSLRKARDDAVDNALIRATSLQARIDGRLMADIGSLTTLAHLAAGSDLDDLRRRVSALFPDRPQWRNAILTDVGKASVVWETDASGADRQATIAAALGFAASGQVTAVGGYGETSAQCGCVPLHALLDIDHIKYVLTVERDIVDFQSTLLDTLAPQEVGAVVDRDGTFLARSIDAEKRRGTPGSDYLRDAVRQGGTGVYAGVTLEGLQNRTAYATSSLSGWSTHIAIPESNIALLSAGSVTLSVLAVGVALIFAGAFTWFGVRDLTARRMAERAAVQSQKLEAIGRLSGTIAHDFNNLLGVIVACLRMLSRPGGDERKPEIVQEGLAAADRGAKLIGELLTFAREKPLELDCVDISAVVEGMKDLLTRSLGPAVRLDVRISPRARYATTNAAQLELALLNLAINARDAMPKGGTLTVHTRSASGGRIDLLVHDTGTGMSEEVAARALEPFFTTKGEGKGTGLGLAQVSLLVHRSNGSIILDTAPGKGTTFTLRLAACDPPSSQPPAPVDRPPLAA
ncbi:MAG: ATP-binding protein [Bauldia sp.]